MAGLLLLHFQLNRNTEAIHRTRPASSCPARTNRPVHLRDNYSMGRFLSITAALFALAAPGVAQTPDEGQSIIVAGRIENRRLSVTAADLAKLPKKRVQVITDKRITTFEGAALQDVLDLAGVLFGDKLQGARLLAFVVVEGAPPSLQDLADDSREDDYRALFSLPEIDRHFTKEPAILAITQDGKPIAAPEGPYRIIVPQDAHRARWIKAVKMIWLLHADSILGMGGPIR